MISPVLEYTQGAQGPQGPVGAPGLKGDGYPGVPVSVDAAAISSLPPSLPLFLLSLSFPSSRPSLFFFSPPALPFFSFLFSPPSLPPPLPFLNPAHSKVAPSPAYYVISGPSRNPRTSWIKGITWSWRHWSKGRQQQLLKMYLSLRGFVKVNIFTGPERRGEASKELDQVIYPHL